MTVVALANSDGYWTRASDYNLYQDVNGRFHIVPHDVNEALGAGDLRGDFGADGAEAPPLESGRLTCQLEPYGYHWFGRRVGV